MKGKAQTEFGARAHRNPGTACGSFLTFTFQFNLLNWNYLAPLHGGD